MTQRFRIIPSLIVATVLLELCGSVLAASVSSRISSRFLARGERAVLEVAVIGQRPDSYPEISPVEGIKIQPSSRGPQSQMVPGRRIEHVYSYVVSSYAVGKHRIEPIQVRIRGEDHMTEAIDFSVFNPDELNWSKAKAGELEFRYACAFKVLDDTPYVNQSVPVEIKLFVPRDLFVIDWGIPDFERNGLSAWRMQPREMRSEINLLGMPYIAVAYPSTLTPNREGEISIGAASIRLISTQVVMDGILRRMAVESRVQVPRLTLQAKALPQDAPSGFENAVGKFKIRTSTGETNTREGDPIPVDIVVTGNGNLDILRAPHPVSPLGWKVYEASRQERGEQRREVSGSISFQQFLRPLELKAQVPAYRLVYFNPETEKYESVQTEPIPLEMTPAARSTAQTTGPPPERDTPVEQMTDILGLIPNGQLTRQGSWDFPQWWLHSLGALVALSLVLRAMWLKFAHLLRSDPQRRRMLEELKKIESIRENDRQFLMASGRFIERWLGAKSKSEISDILAERDQHCFKPDDLKIELGNERRKSILSTLRQHANTCIIIAACMVMAAGGLRAENPNQIATEAYQSARYDEAIKIWLEAAPYQDLSADTLYHIGNASYRAGSPGHAALYYRRALVRDSRHPEARQNLRFIERKYGVITIERPEHQHMLARLSLSTWKTVTWTALWCCLIGVLCFPASRPGAKLRYLALTTLIISPMIAVGGGLGWKYFPTDAAFAPIHKQAVIIGEESALHSEASRNSSVVINTPPGSLCEVLYQSGEWSYVSFATGTRGWLPSAGIERIIPEGTPRPPEIAKPLADETSA